MIQRTALLLAVVLTALILVLIGGIAARLGPPQAAPATAALAPAAAGLDPTAQTLLAQRDAQYRQQIERANQQLRQAYQNQQQLSQQVARLQQAQAAPAPAEYPISATAAEAIVLNLAPGASLARAAQLVNLQGRVAYEVVLDQATVYVDPHSGQLLSSRATAPTSRGQGEDRDAWGQDDD